MTTEQQLRAAMEEEAAKVSAAPDALARLRAAIAEADRVQRRRRFFATTALLAAALVVVVGAAAVVLDRDDKPRRVTTVGPNPSSTEVPTTVTTPTTAKPSIVLPPTVVAYSSQGRIVELSSATGKALRTLATTRIRKDSVAPAGSLAASPDGKTVYYDTDTDTDTELWQVPRAGGTPVRIGVGRIPAVSPDGKTLAYSRPDGSGAWSLVLRDVATGTERVLGRKDGYSPNVFFSLSWSPDNRHLLVYWGWETNDSLVNVDTATATLVDDGELVSYPRGGPQGEDYREHHFRSATSAVAINRCCSKDAGDGRLTFDKQWVALRAVNVKTGVAEEKLADLGTKDVLSLSVDFTGKYVVYALDGEELWAWSGGLTKRLGTGFVSAAF
jgi:WD40 repeat protein